MSESPKICVRCNEPVVKNAESYDVFEKMHWLCFHLEFEHSGDADTPCEDPSCPWWHIEVFRKKLIESGLDPQAVLTQAIQERWQL
jgi:hypothetical protein